MLNVNKRDQRIGESKINFQGLEMVIIAYRSSHDLDVKFEDGYIKEHTAYKEFCRGSVGNPNFSYQKELADIRIGESSINTQGLEMTITAYRNSKDVTVRFADGEVVHCDYGRFKSGSVQNPKYKRYKGGLRTAYRLGETNVNTQGDQMKIIEYNSADDISVQFDDGLIRTHTSYDVFKSGKLRHPNKTFSALQENLIGKEFVLNCEEVVTVIQVNSCSDLTIQFKDGTTRDGIRLAELSKGYIRHPDETLDAHIMQRNGKHKLSNCGIFMQIVDYAASDKVAIQFETGYVKQTRYREFHKGKVGHPFPYQIGNITMNGPAYIYNNEGNFYCFCNQCKRSDILTISEIKEHKCIAK